jgi:hypothetical protein
MILDGNGAKVYTEEEQLALKKMESSINHDGTLYKTGVPWKENQPKLKNNYEEASARLCNTEKKLRKDKFLGMEYQKTIEAYIEKGYLHHVKIEEELPSEVWYLPHFLIVRMDKTTTKVCIVFDWSAKCNRVALNNVIYAGPKLQKDLIDVLIRFVANRWRAMLEKCTFKLKLKSAIVQCSSCWGMTWTVTENQKSTNSIM